MTEQQQDTTTEPVEPQTEPEGSQEDEQDTFPRAYVEQLRAEAAENRTKAKEADTLREALRVAYLREGSAGLLREPLPWSDEYDGDDGMPDADRIREAAEVLAADKPWLSRPRGDVAQGFRGEQDNAVDLAGLLRAGA